MARKRKPDWRPKAERARQMRVEGRSWRAVATAAKVATPTVKAWIARLEADEAAAGAEAPPVGEVAPTDVPPLPERLRALSVRLVERDLPVEAGLVLEAATVLEAALDDDEPEGEEGADSLAVLRRLHRRCIRSAATAERAGNYSSAQRSLRDAAQVANSMLRAERERSAEGDGVFIPRSQIDTMLATRRAQAEMILAEPYRCHDCGRMFRSSFAHPDDDPDPSNPVPIDPGLSPAEALVRRGAGALLGVKA